MKNKQINIALCWNDRNGKYTVIMGRKLGDMGRVIAIEPEPNNFRILKKNIELNQIINCNLINCAAYSKKTDIGFF